MRKLLGLFSLFAVISIIIFMIIFSYAVKTAKKGAVKIYEPDTTITIHNGKPDTIIVKKNLPSWLK